MAYAGRTELPVRARLSARRAVDVVAHNGEGLIAAGLAFVFIGISTWWVLTDERIPNGDNGKHIVHAFGYLDQFRIGHWLSAILLWTQYPPLVHVVGAAGAAVGGTTVQAVVIAENLVFVPLLALGCYGAGRVAFGPLAGLLALVFALAAPMMMSLFHVFMLDGPAAALAALSVWFLLASRRFSSLWWTFGAAAAAAAGMYVKATFIFFVVGLALALLVRGGWKHWRNAVLASGLFLILVEPWYFAHLADVRGLASGAVQPQAVLWYGSVPYPSRWSIENFTWYWWSAVNNQLYVPLVAFAVVGIIVSLALSLRERREESYVPELVFGLLVAYVGVSMISLDDPRYFLPATVYLAVLGTGWITRLPVTARIVAAGVLATVLIVNTATQNWVDRPQTLSWALPNAPASPIGERTFTILSNRGYIEGQPHEDGVTPGFVDLLKRAREDGAKQVVFQPESMNSGGYNLFGLAIFARAAGLQVPGFDFRALGPEDIYVFRLARDQVDRPACLRSWDTTGIYMFKGPPAAGQRAYCPPAAPE